MCRSFSSLVFIAFLFLGFPLAGCKKVFQYSPYSGQLPKGYDGITTQKNLEKLQSSQNKNAGNFKIAVLSDSHYFLTDLGAAVDAINKRNDIALTVLAGDMSDQGLEQEYLLLYDQLVKLKTPLFTVIGNHDYLSNASMIYSRMFGPYNYTFEYGGYNFIFFDSNFWEKNGRPDFPWLKNALENAGEMPSVLVSHIPPFGDQYDPKSTAEHLEIVRTYNVPLSIHGHVHHFSHEEHYEDGTEYLVVPSVEKRKLCIISFQEGTFTVTMENY